MRYITLIIAIALLPSCKALKNVSHDVRDSVVIKTVDSVVYRTITTTKDSVVLRDSIVHIKSSSVELNLKLGSTKDVIKKSGGATIIRTVDGDDENITATCDSQIIIVPLRFELHTAYIKVDSLSKLVSSINQSHNETTEKEKSEGWFGRTWGKVKNTFAWIGLIAFAYIIFKIIKRYFIA